MITEEMTVMELIREYMKAYRPHEEGWRAYYPHWTGVVTFKKPSPKVTVQQVIAEVIGHHAGEVHEYYFGASIPGTLCKGYYNIGGNYENIGYGQPATVRRVCWYDDDDDLYTEEGNLCPECAAREIAEHCGGQIVYVEEIEYELD